MLKQTPASHKQRSVSDLSSEYAEDGSVILSYLMSVIVL